MLKCVRRSRIDNGGKVSTRPCEVGVFFFCNIYLFIYFYTHNNDYILKFSGKNQKEIIHFMKLFIKFHLMAAYSPDHS